MGATVRARAHGVPRRMYLWIRAMKWMTLTHHGSFHQLAVHLDGVTLYAGSTEALHHIVDTLNRRPLPTARTVLREQGKAMSNRHWLSRLPKKAKTPKFAQRLKAYVARRPPALRDLEARESRSALSTLAPARSSNPRATMDPTYGQVWTLFSAWAYRPGWVRTCGITADEAGELLTPIPGAYRSQRRPEDWACLTIEINDLRFDFASPVELDHMLGVLRLRPLPDVSKLADHGHHWLHAVPRGARRERFRKRLAQFVRHDATVAAYRHRYAPQKVLP